jgi:putative ABC transport system substrate-binding protein
VEPRSDNDSASGADPVSNETTPAVTPTPAPKRRRAMNKKALAGLAVLLIALVGTGTYLQLTKKTASPKVYHVGVLNALDFFGATTDGFKQKMTQLGYVEGKNIVYDVQKAPTPTGNLAIIKRFVNEKVDLILAFPTEASQEAEIGTKGTNIPIVSADIFTEDSSLVDSLQHPGHNITGVRFPGPEAALKRFEILHELAPTAKRFLIPTLTGYPTVEPQMAVLIPAAKTAGITLVPMSFTDPGQLSAYLAARPASGDQGFDAILLIAEPLAVTPAFYNEVYAYGDLHKMPIAGGPITDTATGSMFSLIADSFNVGELAAPLADKIFKGTPAGNIPIVSPELVLQINDKAIQRLGLTIDPGLLSTASKIVH